MKTSTIFGLVGAASLGLAADRVFDPDEPRELPTPKANLTWGDINVLHTTDIHGWIIGHRKKLYPELSWSGNFGDLFSFVTHMRSIAEKKSADLFLFDTGDRRIGHGLTDKVFKPNTVNGQLVSELYIEMGYDAVVPGNHDLGDPAVVKYAMEKLADKWEGKYLTSNIRRVATSEKAKEEPAEFLGIPYRYWKTKNKKKIMAYGVVLSGATVPKNPSLISITPVRDMIKEDWFNGTLKLPTDVFVVLGHIDAKDPRSEDNMKLIHDAIRAEHPFTPILMFGGHSHQRYCKRLRTSEPSGRWRSMLLQSGRYFDTIGWMSAKLDDNRSDQDLEITRRYLDNNVQTYMYHTGMSSLEEFETKKGAQIADYAFGIDRTEGLNQVYGYLESNYYLDRKEWTEKENDTQSLFSFYLNATEDILIDKDRSENWMFFSNWGIVRGDIYRGAFTLGDFYTISPNDKNLYKYVTVNRSVADKVVRQLQLSSKKKLLPDRLQRALIEDQSYMGSGSQAHAQLYFNEPAKNNLTYGWRTTDDCGVGGTRVIGEGDDIEHEPIPQVSLDASPSSGLPAYFWRKSYKNIPNLSEDAKVDLIFPQRIGEKVPDALNAVTGSKMYTKESIQVYSNITQDRLIGLYVRKNFKVITDNVPFPE
ncbi:Ser/thr phosphatase family protein [Ceratobasidium theobromae]|uniref:Ser/thr phosphatase family protein n=1 Tax=Ceratobasidium theobromae TaxID=1582974 RepID=A0A5N5QJB9_9AGAM|nr:Ser/thr phosphatase family protein [Ceratobasidium theobromae]